MPTTTELRTSLGKRIRFARTRLGLTLDNVAERCGVSRQAVSQWENGSTEPTADKQITLARTLKVDWDELFKPSTRKRIDPRD